MVLALSGCATAKGSWPALALRPDEIAAAAAASPSPVAACALAPLPPPSEPLAPLTPLPAGLTQRIAAAEASLDSIGAQVPAQADRASKARAAARSGRDEDGRLSIAAEVEQSRLEAIVLPLASIEEELAAIDVDASGHAGAEPVLARVTAARERAAALSAQVEATR
jgi:hypothetical protein